LTSTSTSTPIWTKKIRTNFSHRKYDPKSYDSFQDSEPLGSDDISLSISSSFFPGAQTSGLASDLILVSSDSVYFYVHSPILLSTSQNGFNSLLPVGFVREDPSRPEPILAVPERSSVLNVILHIIYHMSCTQYSPSFDILVEAVRTLKTYGISAKNVITPSTPLHGILLTHAADRALELFALASQNDLYDLAVSSSSFLLSISLSAISDQMAEQIGPIYLKRLFFMHLGRAEVLRNILLPPPYPHTPTSTCDTVQQKNLTRAWALASASLVWDARADVSINAMKAVLSPLGDFLPCELCRTALNERIQTLTSRWLTIKRTI